MLSCTHTIFFSCSRRRYTAAARLMMSMLLLLMTCLPAPVLAGKGDPVYYETSVFLVVQGIGGTEVPAFVDEETAFLSLTDVFDFLKIRNILSRGSDTISGFFITEQNTFLIDAVHNRIRYQGKIIELQQGTLIRTTGSLFMKSDIFGLVFGLACTFNFRSLSVNMSTKVELPAIREMRQEVMRRNIRRLKGQLKADTVIGRTYPLFQFGMADWSVIATQRSQGVKDTRVNLALGAIIAGGETIVALNYNNYAQRYLPFTHDSGHVIKSFDKKLQYYRWRFVNNDHPWLRQVTAGKIFAQSTSSIYDPVVGVQFTNTPSTYRRSFGSYTLSNYTEPDWSVELYVNNELVDYTKADASGFFTFQVPLVYGNSMVKLRFYGPWGEERFREGNISIPFNFLPHREFEYTVSAGMVEDSTSSRFARAGFNYGATRHVTVGGGVEYLSSVKTGKTIPFVNVSLRVANNLLFSGDYTYGVRARGFMTYRLPSNFQVELNYTRYKKGQKAINYNYLEERKLVVSTPLAGRRFSAFSRVTLFQIILPETKYTTAEWLLSGAVKGVGANFTTNAILREEEAPFWYSNLSLSFRLPAQLVITPQVQYEYNRNKVMSTRCELGKYLLRRGYVNVSYERNFKSDFSNLGIGLRYDLNFSQVSLSVWRVNKVNTMVQSARGSLIYDGQSGHLNASSRSSVGTGGVVILPFLDLNNNSRRDPGEPKVEGLQIAVSGGRIFHSRHDSTIRILDLEPYSNYFIDMSRNNFENIAWRVKNQIVRVTIDPNRVKLVEVPVVVMGEVSGTVYLKNNNGQTGLGRIVVRIFREDGSLVARVLTEADGFFNFIGLVPGNYIAQVDMNQLDKLGMIAAPVALPFQVSNSREGDVVDRLQFLLQQLPE